MFYQFLIAAALNACLIYGMSFTQVSATEIHALQFQSPSIDQSEPDESKMSCSELSEYAQESGVDIPDDCEEP